MNPLEFARWLLRLQEELKKLVEEGEVTEAEANRKLREASEQRNNDD
jgi:hypothetical protein